jgi:hypothetical protein
MNCNIIILIGEQQPVSKELEERVPDYRERDQQGAGLPGVRGSELHQGGGEPPLHRNQVGVKISAEFALYFLGDGFSREERRFISVSTPDTLIPPLI